MGLLIADKGSHSGCLVDVSIFSVKFFGLIFFVKRTSLLTGNTSGVVVVVVVDVVVVVASDEVGYQTDRILGFLVLVISK